MGQLSADPSAAFIEGKYTDTIIAEMRTILEQARVKAGSKESEMRNKTSPGGVGASVFYVRVIIVKWVAAAR